MLNRYKWTAIVLILLGAASYGILSPFIKIAYRSGWNDGEITASQMTLGTVITWLLVLIRRKSWSNPFRAPWIKLSAVGIIGLAMTTVVYNITLMELDATLAIVLLFQFTWITVVMNAIANRRWPNRYQMAAIFLVLTGTLLAVNVFAIDWQRFSIRGIIYGLSAAFSYSLFLFLIERIKDKDTIPTNPLMKSAIMLTAALVPIYWIYPPQFFVQPGAGSLLLWGLLLGTLGQVIPTLFFNIGIPRLGSSFSAMLGSVELPVAVLGALLIVGEKVVTVQWLGMLLILLGIVVSEFEVQ